MNKVKLGFFSFTEITDPGEHVSYNTWHQLDHVPENIALPGIAHGQRWVRTPACEALHRPGPDADLNRSHYMTLYLMTEPVQQTLADFKNLGARTSSIGTRFHRFRTSHLNGSFLLTQTRAASRILISPEAVPYRPTRGIFVAALDVLDHDDFDAVTTWYDRIHYDDVIAVDGVAGVWGFVSTSPRTALATTPPTPGSEANPPGRIISVYYLDGDPIEVTNELYKRGAEWRAAGRGLDPELSVRPLITGPYETITPWQWDWFENA